VTGLGARPAPYRIATERLVVRCWDPPDAPLLKDAIDSSLDHLRASMPWAYAEPEPLQEKVELLRVFRARFDLGEEFVYGIFTPDESEVVGGGGLHPRIGSAGFEIGYWIRASRLRRGFAAETSAALTRAAFDVCGVDKIEIHVDPANVASCGVPRKLGYVEEGTLRRRLPPLRPGGPRRDELVFALLREEYDASRLATFPMQAYDAAGTTVIGDSVSAPSSRHR
jgi:RimJ/RimL family protein N-acetyltransferase